MYQLLNEQKHDVLSEVLRCHLYVCDPLFENGPAGEHSAWKPLMYEDDNCGDSHLHQWSILQAFVR